MHWSSFAFEIGLEWRSVSLRWLKLWRSADAVVAQYSHESQDLIRAVVAVWRHQKIYPERSGAGSMKTFLALRGRQVSGMPGSEGQALIAQHQYGRVA